MQSPYPPNISTACLFWRKTKPIESSADEKVCHNDTFSFADMVENSAIDGSYLLADALLDLDQGDYIPCRVLYRASAFSLYTVQIFDLFSIDDDSEKNVERPLLFVKHFPHQFIKFVRRPYTSDQHIPWAFRHPIVFSDDIFPSQWKDLER